MLPGVREETGRCLRPQRGRTRALLGLRLGGGSPLRCAAAASRSAWRVAASAARTAVRDSASARAAATVCATSPWPPPSPPPRGPPPPR
ncbi:hypothetical protein ACH4SP_12200 [Streptomyces sp. NPDC021093]|uniref:hypothetical protein n=1 Tax=Streptomyces sp. NPDC021093 TaxID=3365112 RepID=UPI0037A9B38B